MKNNSLFSFIVFICFLVAGYVVSTRFYRTGYGMSGVINSTSAMRLYSQNSDRDQALKYLTGTRANQQSAMGLQSISYPSVCSRLFGTRSNDESSDFVTQLFDANMTHQDIHQVVHEWKNVLKEENGSTCKFQSHEVSDLGY